MNVLSHWMCYSATTEPLQNYSTHYHNSFQLKKRLKLFDSSYWINHLDCLLLLKYYSVTALPVEYKRGTMLGSDNAYLVGKQRRCCS